VTLRYGVIGAGVVAPSHLEAIAALDEIELVGIAALHRAAAEALARDHHCRAVETADDLLADGLDVAVICTPHPSHAELTIRALESGAHVLCEKPLAPEVREADAMIAAADRAGRLLGVCFQQRFRPVIAAARRLLDEGRLGTLMRTSIVDPLYRPNAYYRSADWRGTWKGEGGGVLMNQAPHTLDLLCHLAGPPATVRGIAQRRAQPMEAEDTATALLTYADGAFGTVAVGTHPAGASPVGCLGMLGDTWEWTAGGFDGYPGFAPYPYREYSEVFFGGDYRVLRGGSWATRARVATPTFRNWDHPQRRQIFAGLRIAKDA